MDPRSHLESRLRADRDKIVDLVRDMVRIPSENPPGDTTALYAFVSDYLQKRGIDYQTVAPQPAMPNLMASFEGGEPGRHLVLNGHLDVFPAGDPAAWSDEPFSGAIRDGRLYGRGVIDMKVGTAASLLTYLYLSEIRQHLSGKLSLTAVSDEETFGRWGTQYLLDQFPELLGDCVLNGEPSTPNVVRFGEKGLLWLELRVNTTGGYGGHTQSSRNAIKETAGIIRDVEALTDWVAPIPADVAEKIEAARAGYDALLGPHATDTIRSLAVNIGVIEGGAKMNLIAAQCRTEIDIRCPIGISTDEAIREFERILSRYAGASYTIVHRNEQNYSDPNHPMVGIIQQNAVDVRGVRPLPNIALAGTDCRFWRLRGVPAYVYGPTPYNMGAPDEYATIDDLLGTVHVHVLSAFDYLTDRVS
jgi:succinyl-diaminopimelate desuccinylase